MITLAFFTIFASIAYAMLYILPDSPGFSLQAQQSIIDIYQLLNPFTQFIDTDVFVTLITSVLVIEFAILTVYLVNFVIRKIPGVS